MKDPTVGLLSGSIYKYDSNFIQPATDGDIVYFHIQLPDENPYPNTTVCAIVYNCETELISQNKTIFEYGKDIRENGEKAYKKGLPASV